jgi:hypothetical protein
MQAFYSTGTALAVTTIYILWQRYSDGRSRRGRAIHERAAYMLWTMASQIH